DVAEVYLAEIRSLLQHRVEHGSEVAGRRIDDLQHLGGCRLLIQRLAGLGDQARVLHCDDRLGGEVLKQCDLLFGEGSNLLTKNVYRAQECVSPKQRKNDPGAHTAEVNQFPKSRRGAVSLLLGEIGRMDQPSAAKYSFK